MMNKDKDMYIRVLPFGEGLLCFDVIEEENHGLFLVVMDLAEKTENGTVLTDEQYDKAEPVIAMKFATTGDIDALIKRLSSFKQITIDRDGENGE